MMKRRLWIIAVLGIPVVLVAGYMLWRTRKEAVHRERVAYTIEQLRQMTRPLGGLPSDPVGEDAKRRVQIAEEMRTSLETAIDWLSRHQSSRDLSLPHVLDALIWVPPHLNKNEASLEIEYLGKEEDIVGVYLVSDVNERMLIRLDKLRRRSERILKSETGGHKSLLWGSVIVIWRLRKHTEVGERWREGQGVLATIEADADVLSRARAAGLICYNGETTNAVLIRRRVPVVSLENSVGGPST